MHRVFRPLAAALVPLLAFLVLGSWALSSSVGSSPDDNFHLPAIWCGIGDRPGLCENPGDPVERLVPAPIVTSTCYVFDAGKSGSCWNAGEPGMLQVDRANIDRLYPPLFYTVMAPFASEDVQASVLAMRLFNSAIAVGLLTAVFFALPRRLRTVFVVSVGATVVPLGLFILASTNPSSWAYLSAATVWITLYGTTITQGRRRLVLAGMAVLGAIMGAGARGDSAVYAVFAVVLVGLLALRWRRVSLPTILAGAAVFAVSLFFYFTSRQGAAVVMGLDHTTPPLSGAQQFINLTEMPTLWIGALGGSGLGWLDTPMPSSVYLLTFTVFAAALFIGIGRSDWRRLVALGLALASLWVVPFVLLTQSNAIIGTLVQPRYILPLMVIVIGVASLHPEAARLWRGPRSYLAMACLGVAMTVALHTNIRRYTTGIDVLTLDPGARAEWWWTGAPSPIVTWIGGSLAFVGVLFALILMNRETATPTGSEPLTVADAPSSGTPTLLPAAASATSDTMSVAEGSAGSSGL